MVRTSQLAVKVTAKAPRQEVVVDVFGEQPENHCELSDMSEEESDNRCRGNGVM